MGRGANQLGYLGLSHCGDAAAWRNGGAGAPLMRTDAAGSLPCCLRLAFPTLLGQGQGGGACFGPVSWMAAGGQGEGGIALPVVSARAHGRASVSLALAVSATAEGQAWVQLQTNDYAEVSATSEGQASVLTAWASLADVSAQMQGQASVLTAWASLAVVSATAEGQASVQVQTADYAEVKATAEGQASVIAAWHASVSVSATAEGQASIVEELQVQTPFAWGSFFPGASPTIGESFNVSSITRNGVGDYTIHFSTSLASVSYCAVFGLNLGSADTADVIYDAFASRSTSSIRVKILATSSGLVDCNAFSLIVFGS